MKKKLNKNYIIILLTLLLVITITLSIVLLLKVNSKETSTSIKVKEDYSQKVNEIAKEVKNKYKDATLYICEEEKTIYLEYRNMDLESDTNIQAEVMEVITKNTNTIFKDYEKLIILAYINSNGTNDLVIRDVYNLPTFKKEQDSERHIEFSKYEDMYNTLNESQKLLTEIIK